MSRRLAGLLVFGVVVLAAVGIPRITAPTISGTSAMAPSAPGPPREGDCLIGPAGSASWGDDGQPLYPPAATGPCTGQRFGEVTAVIPASKTEHASTGSITDPNLQTCKNRTDRYLGLTTSGGQFPVDGGWSPFPSTQTMVAGPDATQKAAGQRWLACIVYIDPGEGEPRASDYGRTAKDAYSTGTPPPAFATCLRTAEASEVEVVSCYRPHQAELIGIAFGPAATSAPALANQCNTLVSRYTQIPETTVDARLIVSVNAFDTAGKTISAGMKNVSVYQATCLVTPTAGHQLTGPLMGLGTKPLPLS